MTKNINQLIIEASQKLLAKGISSANLDALVIFSIASKLSKEEIIMNYYNVPSQEIISTFNEMLDKRLNNIPIAYLRGNQEFWSMNFKVNYSTLIPRPDSEILVASVIKHNTKEKGKIIDLGTGSGCLLLSILSEMKNFTGIGVDKSTQAIEIAKLNALELKLDHQASFINSDWNELNVRDFDILISNPPYIPTLDINQLQNEVKYEPISALDGGEKGLDCYKEIIDLIPKITINDCLCFFEIGIGQEKSVIELLSINFKILAIERDLAKIPRVIVFSRI